MLKKSFEVFKKNPILILFSLIYQLFSVLINSDLVKGNSSSVIGTQRYGSFLAHSYSFQKVKGKFIK